jgi:hypothetical protein
VEAASLQPDSSGECWMGSALLCSYDDTREHWFRSDEHKCTSARGGECCLRLRGREVGAGRGGV